MKVKMITTMAGPRGGYQPGQVVDVSEWEAVQLVNGGFAEMVTTPAPPKPPAPPQPAPPIPPEAAIETADDVEAESRETATSRNHVHYFRRDHTCRCGAPRPRGR
jgi:hypothetical protein